MFGGSADLPNDSLARMLWGAGLLSALSSSQSAGPKYPNTGYLGFLVDASCLGTWTLREKTRVDDGSQARKPAEVDPTTTRLTAPTETFGATTTPGACAMHP